MEVGTCPAEDLCSEALGGEMLYVRAAGEMMEFSEDRRTRDEEAAQAARRASAKVGSTRVLVLME